MADSFHHVSYLQRDKFQPMSFQCLATGTMKIPADIGGEESTSSRVLLLRPDRADVE